MKNLYLVSQTANDNYDTYDSFVVCATSEEEARSFHPSGAAAWNDRYPTWCAFPNEAVATFIGIAHPKFNVGDVVITSYNAG